MTAQDRVLLTRFRCATKEPWEREVEFQIQNRLLDWALAYGASTGEVSSHATRRQCRQAQLAPYTAESSTKEKRGI